MAHIMLDAFEFGARVHPPLDSPTSSRHEAFARFQKDVHARRMSLLSCCTAFFYAVVPRAMKVWVVSPAVFQALERHCPLLNLTQYLSVEAVDDQDNFFSEDMLDAFLSKMWRPRCLTIANSRTLTDAFAARLASKYPTLELVRTAGNCPRLTAGFTISLLRNGNEFLRRGTAELLCAEVEEPQQLVALYRAGIVNAVIEMMIDNRNVVEPVPQLSAALYLLDHIFRENHVLPTPADAGRMCRRIFWLLDHDNMDVLINASCLLSTICQEGAQPATVEAVLASQVPLVALSYLGEMSKSPSRLASPEIKSVHNVAKCISLMIGFLVDRDRLGEVTPFITQHHLLDIVRALLELWRGDSAECQHLRAVVRANDDIDSFSCLFLLIDDLAKIPALAEYCVDLFPVAVSTALAELRAADEEEKEDEKSKQQKQKELVTKLEVDGAEQEDDDEEEEDEEEEEEEEDIGPRYPDMAVSATSILVSVGTFLPFDLGIAPRCGEDHEEEEEESVGSAFDAYAKTNLKRRREMEGAEEKVKEAKFRLSAFLSICDDENFDPEIFTRLIARAAWLGEIGFRADLTGVLDDEECEAVNSIRAAVRTLMLLDWVCSQVAEVAREQVDVAVAAAEKKSKKQGKQKSGSAAAAAAGRGGGDRRRQRSNEEDNVAHDGKEQQQQQNKLETMMKTHDLDTLKSRAAFHLVKIMGNDPEQSSVMRSACSIAQHGSMFGELQHHIEQLVDRFATVVWGLDLEANVQEIDGEVEEDEEATNE